MYIVIVGAGRIGVRLAGWLIAAQHEVAVIDRDASRCAALEDRLGAISVLGDATELRVLAKAGANRADLFVTTSRGDDENLVACQLARHRLGVSRTISLVNIPDHAALFDQLGIDMTIDATLLIVDRIQEELSGIVVEEASGLE